MNEEKEFAWFDHIIISTLILIGYLTDLDMYFLLGCGLSLLGGHALILGKAMIGVTFSYHKNKVLARLMGVFQLIIGLNILFNPNIPHDPVPF
jgi:predicted membrane channel-forming protein YqfA (hemolysin III family)